jgi:eukaryotic-like serine/threonine-protein kinase
MPDPLAKQPVEESPPLDLSGKTVGDFLVLRKLGQGGMGQVYLARQQSLKREVALKILRKELSENPTALKRFQAEAEAVARITHANIVQVYAIGEQDGLRYMALEYVEGRNLRDYLARKGPPDLQLSLTIMRQVAAALLRASEIGIVHRDIKPENIMITRKAEVKVADFGLSRFNPTDGQALHLTQSGMTLGTPLYMSPEQVRGELVDLRSDIYSFGVTCYHLLSGNPPFNGNSPFEVALQHVQSEPQPLAGQRPDLPADLCAMVHRMMAKKREDRYQSARDILRDLAKIQKGLTVAQPPISSVSLPSNSVVVGLPGVQPGNLSGSTTTIYVPVNVPNNVEPSNWPLRILAALGLMFITFVGWWTYGVTHSKAEVHQGPLTPGLPETRLPEMVLSTRERELKNKLDSRSAKPDEVFKAFIQLGVLYVHERRLDDAERTFRELEQEKVDRFAPVRQAYPVTVAGRFGQAAVLAFRDKPKESNDLFEKALIGPPRVPNAILDRLLNSQPEFAQLIADSLTRNAQNLDLPKLSDRLEWLRTPAGQIRGPKN